MKPFLIIVTLVFTTTYFNLFAQINTERYRTDVDSVGFTGTADIDVTAITGNTDFQFIKVGGRLNYNWGEDYTFLVVDGGLGWDDGKKIFNQALAHLRHVHSLNKLVQVEAFFQTDFNKKRLLNERELIGGGLRFRFLKSDHLKIRFGISYFYEHERYDVEKNSVHRNNLFANRLSTYFTFEYEIKNDVQFVSTTYYQPQIGKWNDYKILSDNSLVVNLSSFVDLNVGLNLRFDSKPPETIKNTDTYTRFGFSFKF
ncbi:MAG: DUF481 domain-containing protein [Ignavibacteriaceae bacterium]